MKIYEKTNRILLAIIPALIFCSAIYVICQTLTLASPPGVGILRYILDGLSDTLYRLCGYAISFFLVFKLTNGEKTYKALWSVLCLAVMQGAYTSVSERSVYYFFGIVMGLLCVYVFNRIDFKGALIATAVLAILLGLALGWLFDVWDNAVVGFLRIITGRGGISAFLFGAIDNIVGVFSTDLREQVFSRSYGGAVALNGSIVTGAKNIFAANMDSPSVFVSTYLSGHYLFLFALCGMTLALSGEFPRERRYAICFITACSVLSGNAVFFLLFILLESPFLFLYSSAICGGCYLVSYLMRFKIGYRRDGGIVEMFMYMKSPVFFIAVGVAFTVLSYFIFRYGVLKYGISESENTYIPKKLRSIVSSIGGIHNIVRVRDDGIEVRNPKLINTLELDGKLDDNIFYSDNPDLVELVNYI